MPRKAKNETATKTKPTTSKSKAKTKSVMETPKHSQIILEYSRYGNLGLSTIKETVDISLLTQKKFTGRIITLFHFVRNTSVTSNLNSGRTATLQIDNKPILSITQNANDYDDSVFTVTKYRADGTKQFTRKFTYNNAQNLILKTFGFCVEVGNEESESDEILDAESENEIIFPDMGNFDEDTDYQFIDEE